MSDFKRALGVTLAAAALVFIFVLSFEVISAEIGESGFSSGALFVFEHGENTISGEIFGKSFSADISFLGFAVSALKKLAFFLPPPVKFILRLCFCYF